MNPLVTVVIPTHHRPDLLRAALHSVAAQTLQRELFEVVVVASPDDPAAGVVSQIGLGAKCVSIPNDPWGGRSASAKRNYGARLAAGDWLAFLDDDCEADPDWLLAAAEVFPGNVAVEGAKVIPSPRFPTLTYRGLRSFEQPGGFQSCNIFYRRDIFLGLGGFDTRFPFYLEDSDLAWSFLDRGHAIPHAASAVVRHPVNPPAPWRLLDDANRVVLLRLLKNKHPEQFRRAGLRVIGRAAWMHLTAWLLLSAGTVAFGLGGLLAGFGVVVVVALLDSLRLFRGCSVTLNEFTVTTLLLPLVPLVRVAQYLRGCARFRGVTR